MVGCMHARALAPVPTPPLEGVLGALMAPAPTAACPEPAYQKVGYPSQTRGHGLGGRQHPPSLMAQQQRPPQVPQQHSLSSLSHAWSAILWNA